MKRVYLDHAAATPLSDEVRFAMEPFAQETFGNPSAIHAEGMHAREAATEARRSIARLLGVHDSEIVLPEVLQNLSISRLSDRSRRGESYSHSALHILS